jgi:putative tryptophan/tyrosine transport system substrate-binding protein
MSQRHNRESPRGRRPFADRHRSLFEPARDRPWYANLSRLNARKGRKAMRRRDFAVMLGSAVVGWPLAASAQQRSKLPTIGLLASSTPAIESKWTAAFVQRLRELGWIEGRNIAIEYRWGEGRSERYVEIAAEFVRLKVDVIVTTGSSGIAVKNATSVIPIVFAIAGDPVGTGLVASLGRPGGNATGLSLQATELAGKRLGLLREVVPGLRRLAIIGNVGYPAVVLEINQVQTAAAGLGLEMVTLEIRRAEDIALAVESIKGRAEALYVCAEALLVANASRLGALALAAHLPTMYPLREFVDAQGLMSYGPNFPALWARTADIVDKILRGAKPADIPVEQPTKFDLVINLTTAKALDLTMPPSLLSLADEVIE